MSRKCNEKNVFRHSELSNTKKFLFEAIQNMMKKLKGDKIYNISQNAKNTFMHLHTFKNLHTFRNLILINCIV